jgi:hypothetical protein
MSMFVLYTIYYLGDQIKDEIGRPCSTHGRDEKMHTQLCSENLKVRIYLKETNGKIIFKWILKGKRM